MVYSVLRGMSRSNSRSIGFYFLFDLLTNMWAKNISWENHDSCVRMIRRKLNLLTNGLATYVRYNARFR